MTPATRHAHGVDSATPPDAQSAGSNLQQCDRWLAKAFEFLGKRWNGVILGTLSYGPMGFAEVRRGVGAITDSVLSDRLSELAAAGLVSRTVADGRPPSVSYELTSAGRSLLPVLDDLSRWAEQNLPAAGSCTEN